MKLLPVNALFTMSYDYDSQLLYASCVVTGSHYFFNGLGKSAYCSKGGKDLLDQSRGVQRACFTGKI